MPADMCPFCNETTEKGTPTETACTICGKRFVTDKVCSKGHAVCIPCSSNADEMIRQICLKNDSKNPVEILERLMSLPQIPMHGPIHHRLVGSALLSAYRNSGGELDLEYALDDLKWRSSNVPGGACGEWGCCGAGVSAGMTLGIILDNGPMEREKWPIPMRLTSRTLASISSVHGPRCCKRDSYFTMVEAIKFISENLDVDMELPEKIVCTRRSNNRQCIGSDCPFSDIGKD